jgi:hypothetical protein
MIERHVWEAYLGGTFGRHVWKVWSRGSIERHA